MLRTPIKYIRSKMRGATVTRMPDTSWEGSRGTYVSFFRPNLDAVAETLSNEGKKVQTRFNDLEDCAELIDSEGAVIMQVRIHGECCAPSTAFITSPRNMRKRITELFRIHMQLLPEGHPNRSSTPLELRFTKPTSV